MERENFSLFVILSIIFFSLVILFPTISFSLAEEQVPGAVLAVESDPYYFSEGGFGIGVLKFFDRPMTPYLVPGKTTDESTMQEIYQAYVEESKTKSQKILVNDNDRATAFTISFSNGDIKTPQTYNTFSKFTHVDKKIRIQVPENYENIIYGLEIESLPSDDKKPFYENLIKPSINAGKKPEPFDIDIKILTGDGSTLQIWQYRKCVVYSYTPYLDENLGKIKFTGSFVSEIRDKTMFDCDGFRQDFVLVESTVKQDSTIFPILPSMESIADGIIVQFSGGEFMNTTSFSSFSKFVPITKNPIFPISIPGNIIGEKPRFALESHPTKDKESFYKQISRYINPGNKPQPFDVTVHLVTGENNVLQTWKYTDCTVNNYFTFLTDNNLVYKFMQKAGSEIREKTFFECNGLLFDLDATLNKINSAYIPDDSSRAMVFSIHFQGGDMVSSKTIDSFTRFAPVTYEEMQLLIPNAPVGDEPKFYLESLPGKDNQWYYQLMSKYINAGKVPESFDVTINVITGDATTLQNWKYSNCQVLLYKTYYDDTLVLRKFTDTFYPEYRDRTIFQCTGLLFDETSNLLQNESNQSLNPVNFIQSDGSRIKNLITTFSGGDFTEPLTLYTIGKFSPKIEQRSQTSTQFIETSVTIIPNEESGSEYASQLIYNEDLLIEPEEPGISSPTVFVTKPHFSTTQKNDYVKSTEFSITSLPSKDKMPYYDLISRYINPGNKPQPFDVTFDYVSQDGTVLQSWIYTKCQITDFELKFADNLLYFSFSGRKGLSDIVDVSEFQCNGFSVNFDQRKSNTSDIVSVPSLYDMATMNVVSWYGGELLTERSSSLVQEVEYRDDSNLFLGGLPNTQHKDAYDLISRYLNPGKTPEPIDLRIDTITGDGTILFSKIYTKCNIVDSALYYVDGLAVIRYIPGLAPEIRGQSILDCSGAQFKTLPQQDPLSLSTSNLKKISPLIQRAVGIASENVMCNNGYDLMIRPPKNVPICVVSESVHKFEQRGWIFPAETDKKDLIDVLRTTLPSKDDRADSFTITFEGSDIVPPRTVTTFSKFVPIVDGDSAVLRPSTPLDSSAKAFYLESLPSKDKSWYYELASKYVNAGAKPEPFNVTVDVNDGKGDVLQTWAYAECSMDDFVTYFDDGLLVYKMHQQWQSEFRDRTIFDCAGLKLN